MKRLFLLVIMVIFLVYIAPLGFQNYQKRGDTEEKIHTVQNVENILDSQASDGQNAEDAGEDAGSGAEVQDDAAMIAVSVKGTVKEMTLEEYTAGAVAAEMPASFPEAALQAQATAARTFAVYKQSLGKDETHPDAALCGLCGAGYTGGSIMGQ